jgi:hypothetical protein
VVLEKTGSIPASVGMLNEGHLHASLRSSYLEPGDLTEATVDGYIVDILRPGLIIEIQTASFSKIARKVRDLVTRHKVRLVHPVARDRWIVKLPKEIGDGISRRKSPSHLGAIDLFCELVSFPELIAHENLEIDVVLTEEESVWSYHGRRGWRRRGWVTLERRLLHVYDTVRLQTRADYAALMPPGLPDRFLTADLAREIKRPRRVAQQVAYCLRKGGLIEKVGAQGNAVVYARVPEGSR